MYLYFIFLKRLDSWFVDPNHKFPGTFCVQLVELDDSEKLEGPGRAEGEMPRIHRERKEQERQKQIKHQPVFFHFSDISTINPNSFVLIYPTQDELSKGLFKRRNTFISNN